jgi:hypothetical protein
VGTFADAVRIAETELGAKSTKLLLRDGTMVPGAVMFSKVAGTEPALRLHDRLEPYGAYLLPVQYGMPPVDADAQVGAEPRAIHVAGEPDLIGLLPTTDKFEVVRLLGTNGNGKHDNAEVVAWLRKLEQSQPFSVFAAGYDFVDLAFSEPLTDAPALAHELNSFCPDTWASGPGLLYEGPPETLLAAQLQQTPLFHCWWD